MAMDNRYYDLARCMTNAMKCLLLGDEIGVSNQASLCQNVIQTIPEDHFYTKFHMNLVFVEFFNIMSLDAEAHFHTQTKSLKLVRELYGDDHVVLSDICKGLLCVRR
jgi:hypothetical protein